METEFEILTRFLKNLRKQNKARERAEERLEMSVECKGCSYSEGYVDQAVYLCKTCNMVAGVCIACSIACHKGHEVVELGPKPHFRCDCGSFKRPCALLPKKSKNCNDYNHNFQNRFCVCDQEDSESTRESDMHICRGCHDWFHVSCIQIYNDCHNLAAKKYHQKVIPTVPVDTTDYFFLCESCVQHHLYLISKFSSYISLEGDIKEVNKVIDRYPYHVFIRMQWLNVRDEECKLEVKDFSILGIKKKMMEIDIRDVSSDEEDIGFEGSHEDQINIAHGLCVIREMLAQSAQDDIRNNFRLEIKELKRKLIENQNRLL